MNSILSIKNLSKTYPNGFHALDNINLDVHEGEVLALLGPNGAGKTTLIGSICGLNQATSGQVTAQNKDIIKDYRHTRALIGLVPQELTTDAFETVWASVSFSRGLFGKSENPDYIEKILKDLSLWDKKDSKIMTLSGGMKRRLMIAKALSHEPRILFLDEPSVGVDVELRKSMWDQVQTLKESGVTIILTTHYIEEAEEMADRIAVINHGKIIVVEEKATLMKKLGTKKIIFELSSSLQSIPEGLQIFNMTLNDQKLIYTYDIKKDNIDFSSLFMALHHEKIIYSDLKTQESSLEEIFMELVQS